MERASRTRIALVQMCSSRDIARNVAEAERLIRAAASAGASYIQTPEMTTLMEADREALLTKTRPEFCDPALAEFGALAADLGIWLHIGSMAVWRDPAVRRGLGARLANRAYLFGPDGSLVAQYDKIHLFDVELGGTESYTESRAFARGFEAVMVRMPWGEDAGGLGLTICYDLRFPHLFRALAQAGAGLIAVPAAFTRPTGEAHWHALLRARAIETQCFVAAAAQGGRHESGRETYGHSLVVSPWGEILAEGGVEPGIVVADLDWESLRSVRARLPSLRHDREFGVSVVG